MATETQHSPRRWRRITTELAGWVGALGVSVAAAIGMHSLAAQPFHTTLDDPLALPRELTSRAQIPGVPLPPVGAGSPVQGGPAVTVAAADNATQAPATQLASAVSPVADTASPQENRAQAPVAQPTAPRASAPAPVSSPPPVTRPPSTTPPPTSPPPTSPPSTSPPVTQPPRTVEPPVVVLDQETIQRLIDEQRGRGRDRSNAPEALQQRLERG